MKKIYVILMDTKTIPGKLISLFTMCKYSHVVVSLTRDCDITYSFGRKNLYSIFFGGFVSERRDGKFFRKFKNTECIVYEIEVTDKQYEMISNRIFEMNRNRKKYKYDYMGIILRYLGFNVNFKDKYVCSYFVADLLKKAMVYDFGKESYKVRPKDFYDIDEFKLIYRGKYNQYMI